MTDIEDLKHLISCIPNPGSPEAVEKGCTCAVLDNNHGWGFSKTEDGKGVFWISENCPIHGRS